MSTIHSLGNLIIVAKVLVYRTSVVNKVIRICHNKVQCSFVYHITSKVSFKLHFIVSFDGHQELLGNTLTSFRSMSIASCLYVCIKTPDCSHVLFSTYALDCSLSKPIIDELTADRKSTRLNSSHVRTSRMPSSA